MIASKSIINGNTNFASIFRITLGVDLIKYIGVKNIEEKVRYMLKCMYVRKNIPIGQPKYV